MHVIPGLIIPKWYVLNGIINGRRDAMGWEIFSNEGGGMVPGCVGQDGTEFTHSRVFY